MSKNVTQLVGVELQAGDRAWTGIGAPTFSEDFGTEGVFSPSFESNNLQFIDVLRFSGASEGVFGQRFGFHGNIHGFLDPAGPRLPYSYVFEDLCVAEFSVAGSGRVFWGFGDFTNVTIPTSLVGVGFMADEAGNWRAYVADDGSVLHNIDSGISAESVHLLRFEIDARVGQVHWFIDNVEVGTGFTPSVALRDITGVHSSTDGVPFVAMVQNDTAVNAVRLLIAGGDSTVQLLLTAGTSTDGPDQPILTVDDFEATFVDLSGSIYVDPTSPHFASCWQVTLDADTAFANPVAELTSTVFLRNVRLEGLTALTAYRARLIYLNQDCEPSEPSAAVQFTTLAADTVTNWVRH